MRLDEGHAREAGSGRVIDLKGEHLSVREFPDDEAWGEEDVLRWEFVLVAMHYSVPSDMDSEEVA